MLFCRLSPGDERVNSGLFVVEMWTERSKIILKPVPGVSSTECQHQPAESRARSSDGPSQVTGADMRLTLFTQHHCKQVRIIYLFVIWSCLDLAWAVSHRTVKALTKKLKLYSRILLNIVSSKFSNWSNSERCPSSLSSLQSQVMCHYYFSVTASNIRLSLLLIIHCSTVSAPRHSEL